MHRSIIDRVPILQPLNAMAVFAIARCWVRQIYLPEDVIAKAGDPVGELCFLVRGEVDLTFKLGMMGKNAVPFVTLQAGAFFGEECSVECRERTSLFKLQRNNMVKITEDGPHAGLLAKILDPDFNGMVKVKIEGKYEALVYDADNVEMVNNEGKTLAEVEKEDIEKEAVVEAEGGSMNLGLTTGFEDEGHVRTIDRRLSAERRLSTEKKLVVDAAGPIPQLLCTVTSTTYTELLSIPRETYAELALDHLDILESVNMVLGELGIANS
jgi:hypothetical protein